MPPDPSNRTIIFICLAVLVAALVLLFCGPAWCQQLPIETGILDPLLDRMGSFFDRIERLIFYVLILVGLAFCVYVYREIKSWIKR